MEQWWEALGQLYQMLQDSDVLGLSRDARRRLIVAIGALDSALLNCATVDCPIRSAVQGAHAGGEEKRPVPHRSSAVETLHTEADATVQTCRNCRWWNQHPRGAAAVEGMCMLTRTETNEAGTSQLVVVNTLARAAANDTRIGAVLLTKLPYACSQWAPR